MPVFYEHYMIAFIHKTNFDSFCKKGDRPHHINIQVLLKTRCLQKSN